MITFIIPHRKESLGVVSLLNHLLISNDKIHFISKVNFVFVCDGISSIDYSSLTYGVNSFYFISNDLTPGANSCRNIGLKFTIENLVDSTHVIFFDDDDFIPTFSLSLICELKLHVDLSYYFSYKVRNASYIRLINNKRVLLPHNLVYTYNIYGPPFRHLISLNRLKDKFLTWDENLVSCQDWDFYVNLYSDSYKPILIENIVLYYNESLSGITKDFSKVYTGRVSFYFKYLLNKSISVRYEFYFNSVLFFIKRKMYRSAFRLHKELELTFEFKILLLIFKVLFRK